MRENYLMLNGKRIDLTDEQLEKLGLEVKKDYFERDDKNGFYFITEVGDICESKFTLMDEYFPNEIYKVANYCTDKSIMEQRALHETLSRLLWRFSMQNDGDKIDWRYKTTSKYKIYFDNDNKKFSIGNNQYCIDIADIYFNTHEIAQRAIDEIVLPFMKEHPEFVW